MSAEFDNLLSLFLERVRRIEHPAMNGYLPAFDAAFLPRSFGPSGLPCQRHLDRLTDNASDREKPFVAELARRRAELPWGQTYSTADFGQDFLDNYGWLEVVGTRGLYASDAVAAGVLILGPSVVYPDHHHVAEEIYVPLSGTAEWRMGQGTFAARLPGEAIHHASGVSHAIRTGDDPLLALYLWRGGPLAAKSTMGTSA